jgi:uncharacterized protein (TIGR02597 family)
MKSHLPHLAVVFTASLVFTAGLQGQAPTAATSDVSCYMQTTTPVSRDTTFGLPGTRAPAFLGSVSSRSGSVITVKGTPGWTTNQFVYVIGTQNDQFYVEVQSGVLEGQRFPVTANGANTLTVTGSITSLAANDVLALIPHWTFASAFPNLTGILASTTALPDTACSRILLPLRLDDAFSVTTYYYYGGAASGGPGWRKVGTPETQIVSHDVIAPDLFTFVKRSSNTSTPNAASISAISMSRRHHQIGINNFYNNLEIDIPASMTLTQSGLFESGAFKGTTDVTGAGGDVLYVYDGTNATRPPAYFNSDATYFYYTGTANGGPGWRVYGGTITTVVSNNIAFRPGSGMVIGLASLGGTARPAWKPLPPYLQ